MKEQNYDYELTEHIGTIYTSEKGWTFELNIVDWGKGGKYDLRCWGPDHKRFDRGVRFSEGDLVSLYKILKERVEKA